MLSRILSLGSCLMVLTLLLFAGSAAAQDVSPRCEAAIDRAAGHYSKCLLSADASYARHGNPTKLENRQTRCETRFDRRAARAISQHGADACPSSHLVADIEDRTASYAEGVATEAHGQSAVDAFFVQHAEGGTLTESTLTLTDVSRRTGWFAWSGHAHEAGELSTTEIVEALQNTRDDAEASALPLIVDFTMESGAEVFHYDLELSDPVYDEESNTISYTVLSATEENNGSTGTEAVAKSAQEETHFEHSQLGIAQLSSARRDSPPLCFFDLCL